jgi:hypothetical protein
VTVKVDREQLVKLLRSRDNEWTAQRAELSLPKHIDLERDRVLLRKCGIDPNVLAVILSMDDAPVSG